MVEKQDRLLRIEKVLRYRGRGANKVALVHWRGSPSKYVATLLTAGVLTVNMKQEGDLYVILPSKANTHLFPTNCASYYRVALPRQFHLQEEEQAEVGLHHNIYPFSCFEVPLQCDHPYLMLRRFGSQRTETFTLPVGRYRTSLDVLRTLLQSLNKPRNPWHINITIDDELDITITLQDVRIMVISPCCPSTWIKK